MAVDIKRTWYDHVSSTGLAIGATVAEEGCALVSVLEGGIEKVMPSTGAGGETFAGFAVFRQKDFTTRPIVEEASVPSAAPYTVELAHGMLVTGQVRVHDVAANLDLTLVVGAPAAGEASVNMTTGVVTFNAAEAGKAMMMFYRYNLTLAEAKAIYYEAPTNYPDANFFASVGVGKGKGVVYTAYYDDSIDWSAVAAGAITLGAAGLLSSGGADAIPGGRVIHVPSVAQPYLGIEFNA